MIASTGTRIGEEGSDAKILDEDKDTGAQKYRYVKTAGENHYSMAFTYGLMALDHMSMPLSPATIRHIEWVIQNP